MADGGLRRLFRQHLPEAHWQSVETHATGSGVPDANYCFPGGAEGWVEFKATSINSVVVRPQQVAWLERRARAGGRVIVAVRQRIARLDRLVLILGTEARALMTGGLSSCQPLVSLDGGPSRWDWNVVRCILAAGSERNEAGGQVQLHGQRAAAP